VDPILRILLVEDNARLVDELQATLEDLARAKVVAIASAEAAACAWMDSRTNGCDVAIIDMFLKSGSGLGVLEHMRGYERPPQRVVLTNYATPDMRTRCRSLGADAVFDKSTEIEELLDWLAATQVRH
jgi:two-component system OmpR family response regulator